MKNKAQVIIKTIEGIQGGIISIEINGKTLKSKVYLGEKLRQDLFNQFQNICTQINDLQKVG